MTCRRCGAPVPNAATFCRQCGAIVEVEWLPSEPTPLRRPSNRVEIAAALRIAGMAVVIGLVTATALFAVWVLLERIGYGATPQGRSLRVAFDMWLSAHGALAGVGATLTGVVWMGVAARLAVAVDTRLIRPIGNDAEVRTALVAGCGYWVLTTALGLIVYNGSDSVVTVYGRRALADGGGILFNSLVVWPVVALAALYGMGRARGAHLDAVLLEHRAARLAVRGAGTGFSRALGAATIFVAVEWFFFVDFATAGTTSWPREAMQELSAVGAGLVTSGVDLGFAYLVSAMGLFSVDLFPFAAPPGTIPARAWIGVPVFLIVIFLAGRRAGDAARSHALRPALVGFGVGVGILAFAFFASWLASPNADGLTKYSLINAAIWIPVPAVGATVSGQQLAARSVSRDRAPNN